MRFMISLAAIASVLILQTSSLSADMKEVKQHTLEGELKVHPKYLYKYYVAFGNGQTCALYSSMHDREDDSLAALKPGSRIRVRGVLGTEFHRYTGTKENPSPFDSAWILYMDVDSAELVTPIPRKNTTVNVGMTFQQVIKARGHHYRPFIGARSGSIVLVYDDISIDIIDYAPNSKAMPGSVRYIQKTNLDDAAMYLKGIPYADAKAAKRK